MKGRLILSALQYQDIMPIMVGTPTVPGNNHVKPFIKSLATVVLVLIIKMAWQSAELEIFPMQLEHLFFMLCIYGLKGSAEICGLML
jgi:hypothetical protein